MTTAEARIMAAFSDWYAENYRDLEAGLLGDVLGLRERLNAAFANGDAAKPTTLEELESLHRRLALQREHFDSFGKSSETT